jgi:hypothetical protein
MQNETANLSMTFSILYESSPVTFPDAHYTTQIRAYLDQKLINTYLATATNTLIRKSEKFCTKLYINHFEKVHKKRTLTAQMVPGSVF